MVGGEAVSRVLCGPHTHAHLLAATRVVWRLLLVVVESAAAWCCAVIEPIAHWHMVRAIHTQALPAGIGGVGKALEFNEPSGAVGRVGGRVGVGGYGVVAEQAGQREGPGHSLAGIVQLDAHLPVPVQRLDPGQKEVGAGEEH